MAETATADVGPQALGMTAHHRSLGAAGPEPKTATPGIGQNPPIPYGFGGFEEFLEILATNRRGRASILVTLHNNGEVGRQAHIPQ